MAWPRTRSEIYRFTPALLMRVFAVRRRSVLTMPIQARLAERHIRASLIAAWQTAVHASAVGQVRLLVKAGPPQETSPIVTLPGEESQCDALQPRSCCRRLAPRRTRTRSLVESSRVSPQLGFGRKNIGEGHCHVLSTMIAGRSLRSTRLQSH